MNRISKYIPNPIKSAIKRCLVRYGRQFIALNPDIRCAYSQEGEDLVVSRLLSLDQFPRAGFYVDIGAHHPTRYSNTQYFYERGWRGINIDANPGGMTSFNLLRPLDVNLELAIAGKEQTLTFYEFSSPELNGFSKELSMARGSVPGCKIVNTRPVVARPLKWVMDEYLPAGVVIDFISVDVEGLDLEVIKSNDWNKYRPLLLLIEDSTVNTIQEACNSALTHFMQSQGYELVSRTALTLIFAEKNHIVGGLFGARVK